jgi:glucose-6-phosphate isomerase
MARKRSKNTRVDVLQALVTLAEEVEAKDNYDSLSREEQIAIKLRWGSYLRWYKHKKEEKRIKDEIRSCNRRIKSLERELVERRESFGA